MIELSNEFALSGDAIGLDDADRVRLQGLGLIDARQVGEEDAIVVDLARVESANTITVAVLAAWHRHARLSGKSIVFVNLSNELRNIIAFSGLTDILLSEA